MTGAAMLAGLVPCLLLFPQTLPTVQDPRTIRYTVEQGTWLSLDLSPDGRTIVFDLLGDLYLLAREGGRARRLTSGPAFDRQPRFSPDGRRIAFVSDRDGADNVWTVDTTGRAASPVTRESRMRFVSPEWLGPDSILVSRSSERVQFFQVRVYAMRDTAGATLTSAPGAETEAYLGPVASADGRALYASRRRGRVKYDAPFPLWQIVRVDRETADVAPLTNLYGGAVRPILSADGRWMVYASRHDSVTGMRLRDMRTGTDRWLAIPVQRDAQESPATLDLMPGSAFTPDGREVLTAVDGRIEAIDLATGSRRAVPFVADVEQEIGPSLRVNRRLPSGPVALGQVWAPALSPDGNRVAFGAFGRLWVADGRGRKPKRLTTGSDLEFLPAWSPDGRWIAFVTWGRAKGHLWKVPAEGGTPVRLTTLPAFYTDPAWALDGSRLYVLAGSRHDRRDPEAETPLTVGWVPPGGGTWHPLAPAMGARRPHFASGAADAGRVYLSSRDGLVSMRLDKSGRRVEARVVNGASEPPWTAEEISLSPDGRSLLVRLGDMLYAVERPFSVGTTVDLADSSASVVQVSRIGGDFAAWSRDGRRITWSLGSTVFRAAAPRGGIADTAVAEWPISLAASRAGGAGRLLVRGARIVTMRGDEILENADLLVQDDRIAAVGPTGTVRAPAGTTAFDARGKTIVPGLVDAHAHVAFYLEKSVHEPASWPLLANLAYGVTTVHDPQTTTSDIYTYRDLVETGDAWGPRILTSGRGISWITGIRSAEDVDAAVRRHARYHGSNTIKAYLPGDRSVRRWIAAAARKHGMMVTTEGGEQFDLPVTAVLDGFSGIEHGLPVVPLGEDVVQLLGRSGTWYTPTLLVASGGPLAQNWYYGTPFHDDPKLRRFVPHWEIDARSRRRLAFAEDEYAFRAVAASAAAVVRAGGRVLSGSHGQLQGLGAHWELWTLQQGGLSPHEALRSATLGVAEALGVGQDLGSLEPGKLADFLILDRNPLEDIRYSTEIRYVVRSGAVYDGATLDRHWPSAAASPPLFFWNSDSVSPPAGIGDGNAH